MMSGPRVSGFREGWALPIGKWTAHYFRRRQVGVATSLCGRLSGPSGRLLGAGNFRRCKTCAQALAKEATHA